MKYLKIDIKPISGTQLEYPENYQKEIGDFAKDHLYYDENGQPKLLLCIEDANYSSSMLRDRVTEITETATKAISEAHENRFETITDEAKIRRIEIKTRIGQELTEDELAAIDPLDPTSGFSTTKILADRVSELKTMEVAKAEVLAIK